MSLSRTPAGILADLFGSHQSECDNCGAPNEWQSDCRYCGASEAFSTGGLVGAGIISMADAIRLMEVPQ